MVSFERINSFLMRIQSYDWVYVAIEYALIWIIVYSVVRFLRGTRAAGAAKGLLLLTIVVAILSRVIGGPDIFQRLAVLYDRLLALVAIALIVIFQPELRRALVRLGEAPFMKASPKDVAYITDQVAEACKYLSRNKFGAIMLIERPVGLKGLTEGGTILNADLTSRLLQTIFFPGSALHDLAVVIKGKAIHAAGDQRLLAAVHIPQARCDEAACPLGPDRGADRRQPEHREGGAHLQGRRGGPGRALGWHRLARIAGQDLVEGRAGLRVAAVGGDALPGVT